MAWAGPAPGDRLIAYAAHVRLARLHTHLTEDRPMATPHMRGLADKLRGHRDRVRERMDALERRADTEFEAFHDALDAVDAELAEVRAATAEITGDLAGSGNGGPSVSAGESAESEPRVGTWSGTAPALRVQQA